MIYTILERPATAPRQVRYPADVDGMRRILNAAGMDAEPIDIQWAWESFSEDEYFASWLMPHLDDPKSAPWIQESLLRYLVPRITTDVAMPANTSDQQRDAAPTVDMRRQPGACETGGGTWRR